MVSRTRQPEQHARDRKVDPFARWRLLLTRALHTAGRVSARVPRTRPGRALGLAAAYLARPAATLASADARALGSLRTVGVACLSVGVAGAWLLSPATGVSPLQAVIAAGWTMLWALARLVILLALAPPAVRAHRPRAYTVWGAALIPYLLALAPLARLAAFFASAWLTYRGAAGAGADRRGAVRMTGGAFGGQAAVEVASVIMRAGTFVFFALGTG